MFNDHNLTGYFQTMIMIILIYYQKIRFRGIVENNFRY